MTQLNSFRQNLTRRLTFVLSLLGFITALVFSQPAAACGPTPVGDHCSDAGHPINLITGNKFRREVDLPALPGELGLEIVRYYNSSDAVVGRPGLNGLTGRGWRLSYEYSLNQGNHQVVLREPDGVTHNFMQGIVDPERYLPLDPALGYLSFREVHGGREFIWHKTNGYQISFNRFGWTDAIDAPSGAHLGLLYSPNGRLISLTDPQGRSLYFNYPDKASVWRDNAYDGVVSIDSPVGRFVYHYGSEHIKVDKSSTIPEWRVANLIQVDYPTHYDPDQQQHAFANRGVTTSSINRQYHYEDKRFPSFLTGISMHGRGSDGQQIDRRIGTYQYDERGRGILTVLGEPARWQDDSQGKTGSTKTLVPGTGIEQLTIDRSDPKVIVITNSLGQTSRIRFAEIGGEYRILELRGPGCSTCGLSNVRYEYDDMGRRLTILRLDDEGKVVDGERTSYDPLGRIIRITHESYSSNQSSKQNGKQNGKVPESKLISSQLLQRFEYAPDSYQPSLIARPSVVADKEHQIRITYNSAGQPTAITETGYEPLHAQMISRSTTYRYQLINNISVLTEIDGPLANGPKHSP
ncbi:DUF6531 domain-containing protein, partial [Undibacterium sp. Ji67W]|uniref:DUF6531 domain-containing protein n=1 Tax=Undibacterium sp. Ji67W TaxID=3413042 RepID=UPI003BF02199